MASLVNRIRLVEAWVFRGFVNRDQRVLAFSPLFPWSKVPITNPLTTQVPVPIKEAGEPTQPRMRIKVESPQFRSVHWYECVASEDGRLPILLARYTRLDTICVVQRPREAVYRS